MRIDGSQVQNAIYIAGELRWPVGADAWESMAQDVLDVGPFGYIAGGAGAESTMRANREAFERRGLRPRMLVGTTERDTSVEVLGTRSPVPFLLAPIGVLSIAHPEGELGPVRAVLHGSRLLQPARAVARGRHAHGRGDDAVDVPEPGPDVG